MREISLREHLAKHHGWGFKNLDRDGSIARIGVSRFQSCYEPFGPFQRMANRKRLLIRDALPAGTRIRFLSSLKYDVLPGLTVRALFTKPFSFLMLLFVIIAMKITRTPVESLEDMPQLQGDVEMFTNPPYSEFPFDRPMTVTNVEGFSVSMVTDDGVAWTLPASSFATVKQITLIDS